MLILYQSRFLIPSKDALSIFNFLAIFPEDRATGPAIFRNPSPIEERYPEDANRTRLAVASRSCGDLHIPCAFRYLSVAVYHIWRFEVSITLS